MTEVKDMIGFSGHSVKLISYLIMFDYWRNIKEIGEKVKEN